MSPGNLDGYRELLGEEWRKALERDKAVRGESESIRSNLDALSKYAEDPVEFVRKVMGKRTWAASRATMRALIEHRKVLNCSCRKSSKSHTAAHLVPAMVCTAPTRCIVTSATYTQVRENLFSKIRKNHASSATPLPGRLGITSLRVDSDWYAIGISTNKPGNIQGFHADIDLPEHYDRDDGESAPAPDPELEEQDLRRAERDAGEVIEETVHAWRKKDDKARLFFVLDEMAEMRADIIETLAGSWMGNFYVLAPFNPTFPPESNHPASRALKANSGWYRIHISGEEIPEAEHPDGLFDKCFHGVPREIMPQSWIDERRREWTVESALYQAHVRGLPATVDKERQFIPFRLLREAFTRQIKSDGRLTSRHIGWDVAASEGGDFNVAQLWDCGILLEEVQWRDADTLRSADRVLELAHKWGVGGRPIPGRNIHVDALGVGKGPVDHMRRKGIMVDAVDFGSEPKYDWERLTGEQRFTTRKAELLWVMRRGFQEGLFAVDRRFEDFIRQAQWYTFEERPRAQGTAIHVAEAKDEIKKLFGRSPDNLEAGMLACSRGNPLPQFGSVKDLRELSRRMQ